MNSLFKKPSHISLSFSSLSTSRNLHSQPLLLSTTPPPTNKFNQLSNKQLANCSTNDLNSFSTTAPNTHCSKSDSATNNTTNTSGNNTCSTQHNNYLQIAVIGSNKVGKTHLIRQLINCQPPNQNSCALSNSRYQNRCRHKSSGIPTAGVTYEAHPSADNNNNNNNSNAQMLKTSKGPTIYYPIIIFNDHIYNVSLIDCPYLEIFPTNSLQDWSLLGGCNIRDAHGYILVFDVASESSFQYIKFIRDQIISLGIEAPIVIAANKVDLLAINGKFLRNNKREMSAIVKKHWKGSVLIECSTKYNWRVLSVFKELMRMIDNRDNHPKQNAARVMHNALRRNQCSIQ